MEKEDKGEGRRRDLERWKGERWEGEKEEGERDLPQGRIQDFRNRGSDLLRQYDLINLPNLS